MKIRKPIYLEEMKRRLSKSSETVYSEYSDVANSDEYDFCNLHCYKECNSNGRACPLHCGESCPFWEGELNPHPSARSPVENVQRRKSARRNVTRRKSYPKVPYVSNGPNKKYREYSDDELSIQDVFGNIGRRFKRQLWKKFSDDKELDEMGVFLLFLVFIWSVIIISFLFR
jgi:cytochrome c biogenesis protein ResB